MRKSSNRPAVVLAAIFLSFQAGLVPLQTAAFADTPKSIVYCGGDAVKRVIDYRILEQPSDEWNAIVTVNGEETRAMTAYSYFGKTQPPRGFVVALLGEDRSELLVFEDNGNHWLEFGDYRYDACE